MRIPREARNRELVRRGRGPAGFPDRMRTTRNHAGEALADGTNIPGLFLWMVATALVALALTAAGSGFSGWTMLGGILAAVFFIAGGVWISAAHLRVKHKEGLGLRDQLGH